MKKIFVFAAMMAVLISCSNDDNQNPDDEFFNLAEGNLWVYKHYNVNGYGIETFTGSIDSVRITGQEVIDGKTYYKFTHTNDFNSGQPAEELYRVDNNGHLVSPSGFVKHPGIDTAYQFTRPEQLGSLLYQLQDAVTLIVEGQEYTAYPYEGYYTPDEPDGPTAGVGESVIYDPEVGVVAYRCRYLSGQGYKEDRLVYYELN